MPQAPRSPDQEPGSAGGAVSGSGQPEEPWERPAHALPEPDLPTRGTVTRLFGSHDFFRLWLGQVVSATGDWLGFVAIVAIATRIGGSSPAGAISLVMSARLIPGFFLAPVAGVLVDRWDRKRVMVASDLARAGLFATLPFIDTIWGLVVLSLAIEVATLLWSPAKEASVPNLVPADHLTAANSLSLAAAYGTFPVASALFAVLAKVAEWLADFEALEVLRINQESVAIYMDVVTFLVSAAIISTLALPHRRAARREGEARPDVRIDARGTFRELREGWEVMFIDPRIRAVVVALGTGLIGGGMLVPLGDIFSRTVLGGGSAGFGLLLTALGVGMAVSVIGLSVVQRRIPKTKVFTLAVFGAGLLLLGGASVSSLAPALVAVAGLGLCAGAVYVLGFTILHETVADELRGRIFSSLYTLVRFCVLLSFAVGPLLADRLDALSDQLFDRSIELLGFDIFLPGVRLALWLAAVIIIMAAIGSVVSLRFGRPEREGR